MIVYFDYYSNHQIHSLNIFHFSMASVSQQKTISKKCIYVQTKERLFNEKWENYFSLLTRTPRT